MNTNISNPPDGSASPAAWRFSIAPVEDKARLGHEWSRLEAGIDAPFFLSWTWIGCWLDQLGPQQRPYVLRAILAGDVVGIGLLIPRRRRWLGLLPCTESHLHETGDPAIDSLMIEYNGFLTAPALRNEVTVRAIGWLLASGQTDAVHLSGLPAAVANDLAARGLAVHLRDSKPTYQVDLARIRATGGTFAATLSGNTRSQLRRASRQFAALGEARLVAAASSDEALDMLEALIPLHQDYWRGRGRPGAFASTAFTAFHRQLVRDGFSSGCIQLVRCDAGPSPIGYLYNFVQGRRVYSYQSGFDYSLLPRSKPGWLCHHLAIEHNLQNGMASYDLLAGRSQFKTSFAAEGETLVWAKIERDGWRPALLRRLRAGKHWLKAKTT